MKKRTFSKKNFWAWSVLGAFAYLAHAVIGKNSSFMELYYSRGIFVAFRWIWDHTLGLIPVGLIYVFLALILFLSVLKLIARYKRKKTTPDMGWKWFGPALKVLLGTAGALVFFFYLFWGFNYNRIQIEKHLNLSPEPLSLPSLREEAQWAKEEAARARIQIPEAADSPLNLSCLPENLERILRSSHRSLLRQLGYPVPGRVRVRLFHPGSWMMRVNVSGIYVPYFGEGYIPSTSLAVERPFDMAHEMAHAYGFTGEDDCNFLAFFACVESGLAAVAYSGFLNYWLYVSSELRRASPREYTGLWDDLPEGMRLDIKAVSESWRRFQGPLREVGRRVQHGYLKSQGVREGILSYNRMVMLVAAWRAFSSSGKNL